MVALEVVADAVGETADIVYVFGFKFYCTTETHHLIHIRSLFSAEERQIISYFFHEFGVITTCMYYLCLSNGIRKWKPFKLIQ